MRGWRAAALCAAALALAALAGAAVWQAAVAPAQLLIAPGASGVTISSERVGLQVISYDPNDRGWRQVVGGRLRERGWRGPRAARRTSTGAPSYYRVRRIGPVTLVEYVVLDGGPDRAEITFVRDVLAAGLGLP